MDFLIARDELVRTLGRVQGVVEKRTTSPVLSSVLLQARAEGLRVVATDKAMTFIGDVAATVRTPGEIAVDAANFYQTARVLADDVVTVSLLDNQRVEIRSGTATFKLNGYPGSEFPVTPPLDESKSLTIAMGELRRIVDQTLFAVAPDENRYGLNGVHIEDVTTDAGPMLRMVSTDGNRLCWSQAPYSGEIGIHRKMLLPRKGLDQVRRLLEGPDETPVEFAFGDRAALVRFPNVMVHMRLLEADFPDYRQVLPSAYKRRVLVDRAAFDAALRRVSIFAADTSHTVRFAFSGDGLVLTSRKLDAGDSREEIAVDLVGEPVTLGFNALYVQHVLAATTGSRLALELGDALQPCIIRLPEDDRCLFVVMPVRLD